jgi:hypothetical protein
LRSYFQHFGGIPFLVQALLTFVIVRTIMVVMTLAQPLNVPKQLPVRSDMQCVVRTVPTLILRPVDPAHPVARVADARYRCYR